MRSAPFLNVALADTVQPISAEQRGANKNGQSARASEWQVSLIFDSLEAAWWRDISVKRARFWSAGSRPRRAPMTDCL